MTKKLLILIGVAVVLYVVVQWSRADYLAFDAQREAWHRRCDAYVGRAVSGDDATRAKACETELAELTAYATRKGWNR